MKKNETGKTSKIYGSEGRRTWVFLSKNLKEGERLEEPGLDGQIIFKIYFQEVGWDMDWTDLAQDRKR